mgnify:CR=1 FL=1
MTTKLITDNYKLHITNQFIESVNEEANTSYYVYVGNHLPYANSIVPNANNNKRSSYIDVYRNMIMGKRVNNNDISLMVRNIPYDETGNTVYTMYDDTDSNLNSKSYFVMVNEGSYFHVYKCLDNNNGARSTVEPEFSHISGANTELYQTSDGYRWKYMYSVSSGVSQKFSTTDYFPVVVNNNVTSAAVDGSIDIIKILDGGRGYDNYLTGTFIGSDIKYTGIETLYELSNKNASSTIGFYEGCIIYITSGPGAGSYRKINSYFIDNGNKIISIDSAFDPNDAPTAGSRYEIYPEVRISGDGSETINADARALINATSSNSVYKIEMLNRGANYKYITANVIANAVVLVEKNASIRPIYSPSGGHGKNVAEELGAYRVCMSVTFANNESNTILTTNDFRQIGIIKDPLFANVKIEYNILYNSFIENEIAYKINPLQISTNVTTNTVTNEIICDIANFSNQFKSGDIIYLKTLDNLNHQLATVESVTNSSYMLIETNGYFSCTETIIHHANVSSYGYVSNIEVDYVYLTNVYGTLSTSDIIVGFNSGAQMNVNSIIRNNKTKGFETFIQLNKYDGTLSSGSFINDELIYQSNASVSMAANASLHSVINITETSIEIYTSNQVGDILTGNIIKGLTSNATAIINTIYSPELVFGSGDVIYFENVEPVNRNADESENFKVIFEF